MVQFLGASIFAITTAYGTNLTLVAAATGGKPVKIALASVQNGTTNVGVVVAPEVAVVGLVASTSSSAPTKVSIRNAPVGFPAVSSKGHLVLPADSTAMPTPGQQLAAMQTDLDRLYGLPAYTTTIPQKAPPPTPPAGDEGDAIDTFNQDLYARWSDAEDAVTTDCDNLVLSHY